MAIALQRSFAGGEIAPALYARVDQVKYVTGLRTCRNMMVMRHGGVTNRPGTKFVAEVKDSSKSVRLIKFVFNAEQTYVLEFGDYYMRVYNNGGQVRESGKPITNITQANPAVVSSTAHDYYNGEEVYIADVEGMTEINGRNFLIGNVTANTFELYHLDGTNVDSTGYTAYSGPSGNVYRIYTLAMPYDEVELATLNYVQSGDVIILVHPNHRPHILSRTDHASWNLALISFEPSIDPPASVSCSGSAGVHTYKYQVTAVKEETFEESLPTVPYIFPNLAPPTSSSPNVITWADVPNATEYNIYKGLNEIYGYIGVAADNTIGFNDEGFTPDVSLTPPYQDTTAPLFNAVDEYPAVVMFYQQRLFFGSSNNAPETIWASKSANFYNFSRARPSKDDDAVTFPIVGKLVNRIRAMINLGVLLVFTDSGEWAVEGDSNGVISPSGINPRQYSYHGSGELSPVIVGNNVIFLQGRGQIIRDLGYDYEIDGYQGNDLTLYAPHLFEGYEIVDWDFQQNPHSVLWAARNDGVLLGLTYIREHQIVGWHRHDTDGEVENIVVVPEGQEDAVYMVVKRTINGATKRYIERMASRHINDVAADAFFVDSGLSHDGRNTGSNTMTLSGGTTWTYTETLTLNSGEAYFQSNDVDDAIILTAIDGTKVVCTITAFTSTYEVSVQPDRTVPADLRGVATTNWAKALSSISGLWHLEGKVINILGDGNVEPQKWVSNDGAVTLTRPYSIIHAGLPITAQIETLDIDSAEDPGLVGQQKNITELKVMVEASRGIWAGPDTSHLREYKQRSTEGYGEPISVYTGIVKINLQSTWNSNGRIFIQQADPLPLSILSVIPSGYFGR